MAIEYLLQLNSGRSPADLGALLTPPLVPVDWDKPGVLAYRAPTGFLVTVRADGRSDLVLVEPELHVGFRMSKEADPVEQLDELVRLVVRVLAAEAGDAVLQQGYERIILLRRGTQLQLTSEDWFWPSYRLGWLPWPSTRRAMPYPEE